MACHKSTTTSGRSFIATANAFFSVSIRGLSRERKERRSDAADQEFAGYRRDFSENNLFFLQA